MSKLALWNTERKWFLPSLFLIDVIFFLLRKPLSILVQPGRVDDVDVLLSDAIQHGWQSIFFTYNYYFHFVPRLVTLSSLSLFGIANVNLGMNLGAIFIASACSIFFATKQFRFIIKNDLLRAVCSLFFVLAPGVNEIYSNISSIQWFLNVFVMLFTALLLFKYDEYEKKSKKIKYLYAFLLSSSILSSAFSLVFLPVFVYIIIRAAKKNPRLVTLSSLAIPTILIAFEAAVLYITWTQQFKSSSLGISTNVLGPTANALTISITKVFYHDTPELYQYIGDWMYVIPIAVVAFFLLASIRERRFEIYTLLCMAATLLFSSAVRNTMFEWNCLCGQGDERYFFFTLVFAFVLLVRQFDARRSKTSQLIFVSIMIIVVFNISSGFLIPTFADKNWNYVSKLYDTSGVYNCYVGEVPHGWALSVPCSNPIQNNTTMPPYAGKGPSITFTPPVVSTFTSIYSTSSTVISNMQTTFTATVSPTPDGGMIQFQIDGTNVDTPITLFGGQATISISSLEAGPHQISATYLGGPNFYSSTSRQITIMVLSRSNLEGANLSGANLQGMDLSSLDMEKTNLSQANLQGAILSNANLKNANLAGAILIKANLQGTNLEKANLQGANLQDANLSDANLQNGDLAGTILYGANLTNSNLRNANTAGANFVDAITKDCSGCP